MQIKFKVSATLLNDALDTVSVVAPRAITPQGNTGYLFVVSGETCRVYSQDALRVARASFPISEVEGEGPFIYPSQHIGAFKFADGDISFTAVSDGDSHHVSYDIGGGAGTHRTTLDPKLLATCDRDIEAATNERQFPVALLRESMSMSRPFMAEAKDTRVEEHYKTFQIFDGSTEALAKADGNLYASNGLQAFFFHCDAFKGKGLSVHGQHLPLLASFLARCEGDVTFKDSANKTFAIDSKGHVLGWTHHKKMYERFSYYGLKLDKIVLAVPKARALNSLRYTKSEMDSKRDKIRIHFDAENSTLRFAVIEGDSKSTSPSVDVRAVSSDNKDVTTNVNIEHLIELFEGSKAEEVELRVAVIPAGDNRPKDSVMFRTIDEFWLNGEGKVVGGSSIPEGKEPEGAYRCKVTRFMQDKA
jgi:hypothetical protein